MQSNFTLKYNHFFNFSKKSPYVFISILIEDIIKKNTEMKRHNLQ